MINKFISKITRYRHLVINFFSYPCEFIDRSERRIPLTIVIALGYSSFFSFSVFLECFDDLYLYFLKYFQTCKNIIEHGSYNSLLTFSRAPLRDVCVVPRRKKCSYNCLYYTNVINRSYGIQLWDTAANSNIEIIQRFQNKYLGIIVDAPWYVTNDTTSRSQCSSRVTPKHHAD